MAPKKKKKKPVRTKDLSVKIVQEIKVTGGLTADEIADRLKVNVLLVRPRVTDLKRANKIVFSESRRRNKKGRFPRVLVLPAQASIGSLDPINSQ
jgi:predicted ArsR family transcriptional regulator